MEYYTMGKVFDAMQKSHFEQVKVNNLLSEGILYNCSARIEKSPTGVLETKGNCTE